MCDDMIEVDLNEEEYEQFQDLRGKMRNAENLAAMRFYYSQMKIIMNKAIERKKQEEQ
ncbi:TPA: hypothetical protein ACGW8Q_005727 [Bacillus cereus]